MGTQCILGASVPSVEVLSPLGHFDAVLEPDDSDLHWLGIYDSVGLDVDSVEISHKEAFSLECHSVGLGCLILPFLASECSKVEA